MKFKEFLETELNGKSKSNLEKDAASHIPELSKHILKVIRLEKHDDTLTHTRKIRREWLQTIYRLNKRGDFKLNTSKIFAVSDIALMREAADKIEALEEVVKAVAHVGIDLGYGKYEIQPEVIDKARAIYERGDV